MSKNRTLQLKKFDVINSLRGRTARSGAVRLRVFFSVGVCGLWFVAIDARACMLVLIGVTELRRKELIAVQLGYSESSEHWRNIKGFLYLVAIMDWHTRRVLSWELSNKVGAPLRLSFGMTFV